MDTHINRSNLGDSHAGTCRLFAMNSVESRERKALTKPFLSGFRGPSMNSHIDPDKQRQ